MTIEIFGAEFCVLIVAISLVSSVFTEWAKNKITWHPIIIHWLSAYALYAAVVAVGQIWSVSLLTFWRAVQIILVCAFINAGYKGATSGYDFLSHFIGFLPRRKRNLRRRVDEDRIV